jgi:hypothetical protein
VSQPLESLDTAVLQRRRRVAGILLGVLYVVAVLDIGVAVLHSRYDLLPVAAVLVFFAVFFTSGRNKIDAELARRNRGPDA